LVPATPESLLRMMVELEPQGGQGRTSGIDASNPWRLVALTSSGWLVVVAVMAAGFLAALERQERKIELLLQQTTPAVGRTSVPASKP
jgi:hypothetical protein